MIRRRPLVVWGGTGQCLVLNEFAAARGYRIVVIVDNDPSVPSPLPRIPLVHGMEGLDAWLGARRVRALSAIVAVAGARGGDRCLIQERLEQRGLRIVSLVHPRAYVAVDATVGPGSQCMAHSVVGTRAVLGTACIVNTGATVDHECSLGAGVHVGPGAHLAGCVTVGERSFIGAGATVLPRLRVGCDCIVGAGAVVTKSLPDGVAAWGVPARIHERRHT